MFFFWAVLRWSSHTHAKQRCPRPYGLNYNQNPADNRPVSSFAIAHRTRPRSRREWARGRPEAGPEQGAEMARGTERMTKNKLKRERAEKWAIHYRSSFLIRFFYLKSIMLPDELWAAAIILIKSVLSESWQNLEINDTAPVQSS